MIKIIPTGKILLQLLALPQEVLAQGIKIIQIMSDEKNVEDMRIYYRFFERNSDLEPGYYQKTPNSNVEAMNTAGTDEIVEGERVTKIAKIYETLRKKASGIRMPLEVKESKYGIQIDAEDFDSKNVFQNGQPLQHITRGDPKVEAKDIIMKVFYLNPAFVRHLQSMINIQHHLENSANNNNNSYYNYQNSFKGSNDESNNTKQQNDYMSLWKPAAPLLNGCYCDLLMMGFYNELDVENLIDIPPFNAKNIFIQHNILVVNENGDCIMMAAENTGAVNVCSIFNKILRHSNVPIQQKTVNTAFHQNVNDKGIPPKSKFPSNVYETIESAVDDTTNKLNEIKDKYTISINIKVKIIIIK